MLLDNREEYIKWFREERTNQVAIQVAKVAIHFHLGYSQPKTRFDRFIELVL